MFFGTNTHKLRLFLLKIFSISTNISGEKTKRKTIAQALKGSGDVLKIDEKALTETTKIFKAKEKIPFLYYKSLFF